MSEQTRNRIKLVAYSIFPIIASYLFISYKVKNLNVLDGIAGVALAICFFIVGMRILIYYKLDPGFQDAVCSFLQGEKNE